MALGTESVFLRLIRLGSAFFCWWMSADVSFSSSCHTSRTRVPELPSVFPPAGCVSHFALLLWTGPWINNQSRLSNSGHVLSLVDLTDTKMLSTGRTDCVYKMFRLLRLPFRRSKHNLSHFLQISGPCVNRKDEQPFRFSASCLLELRVTV